MAAANTYKLTVTAGSDRISIAQGDKVTVTVETNPTTSIVETWHFKDTFDAASRAWPSPKLGSPPRPRALGGGTKDRSVDLHDHPVPLKAKLVMSVREPDGSTPFQVELKPGTTTTQISTAGGVLVFSGGGSGRTQAEIDQMYAKPTNNTDRGDWKRTVAPAKDMIVLKVTVAR